MEVELLMQKSTRLVLRASRAFEPSIEVSWLQLPGLGISYVRGGWEEGRERVKFEARGRNLYTSVKLLQVSLSEPLSLKVAGYEYSLTATTAKFETHQIL